MALSLMNEITDKEARQQVKENRPAYIWQKELYDPYNPDGKSGEIIDEHIKDGPRAVFIDRNKTDPRLNV